MLILYFPGIGLGTALPFNPFKIHELLPSAQGTLDMVIKDDFRIIEGLPDIAVLQGGGGDLKIFVYGTICVEPAVDQIQGMGLF